MPSWFDIGWASESASALSEITMQQSFVVFCVVCIVVEFCRLAGKILVINF